MYQTRNYYQQNLGTAGHRATGSYNYLPQYSTPSAYYNPQPPQPPHHQHSRSLYSSNNYPSSSYSSYLAPPPPPAPASHHHQHQAHLAQVQAQVQAAHLAQAQAAHAAQAQAAAYVAAQAPPAPMVQQQQQQQPAPHDEPVNGGINPVLEYDLNCMSTFLSWCTFGMLKQNKNPTAEFEHLITSVLFATRLPKSTIVIALEYINQRYSNKNLGDLTESDIFTKLTIALILANKFNDDNTFTNRSWCGATGLKIELLNHEERVWLQECKWQLNVVHFESNIRTLEDCWVAWVEKYGPNAKVNSTSETSGFPSPLEQQHSQAMSPLSASSKSVAYHHSSSPIGSSPVLSHVAPAITNNGGDYDYFPPANNYSSYNEPMYHHQNSIPSSPIYPPSSSYAYNSSPLSSSPMKYAHDHTNIWAGSYQQQQQQQQQQPQNIWSYGSSSYPYGATCNDSAAVAAAYAAHPHANPGYVGYANPYYGYNIPTC